MKCGLDAGFFRFEADKATQVLGVVISMKIHDVYRTKDVVEKSFLRYKNHLGLDRLRVHSDNRMQNKIFVAFIALVIASAIHETMRSKVMYNLNSAKFVHLQI